MFHKGAGYFFGRKKFFLIALFTSLVFTGFSQTTTNIDFLNAFSQEKREQYQTEKLKAERWAARNNKPVRYSSDKVFFELQYVDSDSIPHYYKTDNAVAAATISTNKVYPSGGLGLNLTGTGITVREWDGGSALSTHQEFGSRLTVADGGALNFHATHVAGTIMAAGVISTAKGMAYQANLRSFDWNFDNSEMATEAGAGALISNHSYGYIRGWNDGTWHGNVSVSTLEDYLFGFYDGSAQDWDFIANNAPYYLICKSAGNDRGESGDGSHPADGPYDCIGQQGVAKNILTVGAVEDIPGGYTNPVDVIAAPFTSWGPADDGRIKPDIVANGIGLYSTYHTSDVSYASMSGTSMATPSATGSLALLQQHYNNLFGSYMLASTLKALAIHTADEAGPATGPNYMFGWGLMNTAKAANLITTEQNNNVIFELLLTNGTNYTRDVVANGIEPLKVTIVWNDPMGTPAVPSLDPITPMLVNDLDLKITREQNTYYPWKLDRDNPASAATNSEENNVDNVEVVLVASPVQGASYTITVDHDGTLSEGSQVFSMIISGIESSLGPDANFSANNTNPLVDETVSFTDLSANIPTSWSWSIAPSTFSYVNGTNANSQNPVVAFEAEGFYTISLTVANAQGNDTETKTNYIQVEGCGTFPLPFFESFEEGEVPPDCWSSIDNDGDGYVWYPGSSGYSPYDGTYLAVSESWKPVPGPLTPDNWLITPQLSITTDSVTIKFAIMAQDPGWLEEKYSILISTTGNDVEDFTSIYTETITTTGWEDITIPITGYAGENVYLAFRHWDCTDWFQLVLDHIRVEEYGVQLNHAVADVVLNDGEFGCYNATNTLTVAGNGSTVELMNGSSTTFIAGENILFLPGFHAHSGCYVDAHITTDGTFCEDVAQQSTNYIVLDANNLKSIPEKTENENKENRHTEKDINIYPNPSTGTLNIELLNFTEPVGLTIYNQLGAVIFKTEQGISDKASLDLSCAPKGLYVVKVDGNNEFLTRKIVLE